VFDIDGIHGESEALGTILKMSEDTPPSVLEPAVKEYDKDLGKLRIPNPYKDGRMPFVLEGNRRLKELCGDKVPVVGYMLRGSENVMRDAVKNKDPLKELIEIATDSLIIYGTAVAHSGADIIFMPDPTSSGDMVSRAMWEQFGLPYTKRLVKAVQKTRVPIILHICGDTSDRLDSLAEMGVEGLSLDSKVNLAFAREALGESVCLIGNVNPVNILLGSPEEVEQESEN
jgi:uroporphyrinogen decarboxylase